MPTLKLSHQVRPAGSTKGRAGDRGSRGAQEDSIVEIKEQHFDTGQTWETFSSSADGIAWKKRTFSFLHFKRRK